MRAAAQISGTAPTILPVFADVTAKSGVSFRCSASHTSQKYLIETMVGGVAMFDSTGDGHLDLFFVNGAALRDPMAAGKMPDKSDPRYWNRLYRNNGDGTFTDVTQTAGVKGHSFGMGVATGDYDNDGRQTLCHQLWAQYSISQQWRRHFHRCNRKGGCCRGRLVGGACFFDYDRDGKARPARHPLS